MTAKQFLKVVINNEEHMHDTALSGIVYTEERSLEKMVIIDVLNTPLLGKQAVRWHRDKEIGLSIDADYRGQILNCLKRHFSEEEAVRYYREWFETNKHHWGVISQSILMDVNDVIKVERSANSSFIPMLGLNTKDILQRKKLEDLPMMKSEINRVRQQYVYIKSYCSYINRNTKTMLPPEKLRTEINTVIDFKEKYLRVDLYNEAFRESERLEKETADVLPGNTEFVGDAYNMWAGWGFNENTVVSTNDRRLGRQWLELLTCLCRRDERDYKHCLQWMAYPIQNPGAKLASNLIVIGQKQGTGKSLCLELLSKVYGKHARTIFLTQFEQEWNDWLVGALFVVIEESKDKAYKEKVSITEKYKQYVTVSDVPLTKKYALHGNIKNRANFSQPTNHLSIDLDDESRRPFFIGTEKVELAQEVYDELGEWQKNAPEQAARVIYDLLMEVDLSDFNPSARPPKNANFYKQVAENKSDLYKQVEDAIEELEYRCAKEPIIQTCDIVMTIDLMKLCNYKLTNYDVPDKIIAKILRHMGWEPVDSRPRHMGARISPWIKTGEGAVHIDLLGSCYKRTHQAVIENKDGMSSPTDIT